MSFGSFKTLGEALSVFQVREIEESFLEPKPCVVREPFREDLSSTLELFDVECSEAAVCENLIYPVLREAFLSHTAVLGLWSHVSLYDGDLLLGVPDYLIAKRSPLSKRIMDRPLGMVDEAKKNDFDAGWGRCLAALWAIQRLYGKPDQVFYGCVSDGFSWRFGKLQGQTFAHHPIWYALAGLDELCAALNGMLELCEQQVLKFADAA
jgi:hypothetical protein